MQLEINIESKNQTTEVDAHDLEPMTVFRGATSGNIGIRTAERGIMWLTGNRQGFIETALYTRVIPVKTARLAIDV